MLIGIIGFFAGIIGVMGMGGGTILIPALILFASIDPKIAQSTNLLSSIPNDDSSPCNTYKKEKCRF